MRGAHSCSGAIGEGSCWRREFRLVPVPREGARVPLPAAGHWPQMSGRNRATWQGSGLQSRVCSLSLQIIQCVISVDAKLENIRKCLALTRLERGHWGCFGVVGTVLCFEVIVAKFVAQKKFM